MNVVVTNVDWRIESSDPAHVDVKLYIDGTENSLGSVAATPETCAIRSAASTVTEMICGDQSFVATLATGQPGAANELVITHGSRELRRIPIGPSVALSVAPYRMPISP